VKPYLSEAQLRADTGGVASVDWERFDLDALKSELRESTPGSDAEMTIWAFEEAHRVARLDQHLLDYLLVATVCLLARAHGSSPRAVLEGFFRRSVSDVEWRKNYVRLLP
jgi:hypothetical protein